MKNRPIRTPIVTARATSIASPFSSSAILSAPVLISLNQGSALGGVLGADEGISFGKVQQALSLFSLFYFALDIGKERFLDVAKNVDLMETDVEIEEYSPNLLERLFTRGAKFEPSLTGTPKIKVSKGLNEEEREELVKHEKAHLRLFRYYVPAWLASMLALSFVSFSCFFWCFIAGLCLWEGIAVMGERGWV